MTLAELQRALTAVEPAAVLVPPRVMEKVIRGVLQLSAVTWSVPHRNSWIVDRTLLFRHVDQGDLALAPDQILPAIVILLSWPQDDDLQNDPTGSVLLETWRQLFHASLHQAIEKAWEDGHMTSPRLREFIEAIGPTAFEEVHSVLLQENILPSDANERAVFNELVATFLELHYFAPALLPTYFPGLRDLIAVKHRLDSIVPSASILQRTRLAGAPDPQRSEARPSEANEYFHLLEVSSEQALSRGNMVQAAIELQRATRVAPGDKAPLTHEHAKEVLDQLLDRLTRALEISEDERQGWRRLLPVLLEKADQGSRPAEAALLYELQKACLDHEREIYKLDILEWLLSAGRRPLQRPLPSQRLVRIARTLRGAMTNLTSARLSDHDRAELESLLQKALHRTEERVRARFRPILTNALQDVGLSPGDPVETIAARKMVEELVDRIIEYGFLTFSDLRDTISRNQLKLPDLTDPQDFIRGDPLIRLDRRLSGVLDGVYRPGEFYLRWLERFTAVNFGTKLGRLVTRCVTLPVGGGYLLVRTIQLFTHPPKHSDAAVALPAPAEFAEEVLEAAEPVVAEPAMASWAFYSLWALLAVVIFSLLHSPALRERLYAGLLVVGRALRTTLIDVPMLLARRYALDKLLMSWPFQLFYSFVAKPAVLTLLLVYYVPQIQQGWLETGLAFFAANFLVNTRVGEAFWETLVKAIQNVFILIRSGLLPGLFRFIVRLYKQVLHSIEGVLFTVDEWLRFRGGESTRDVVLRTLVTLVWLPISYLIRFNLVVFIEPCLHPLKFPVCSIATKFYIPFAFRVQTTLHDSMQPFLGNLVAELIAWWIAFWIPDVVGFVFWEIKENWTLFRANRRQTVTAAAIGPHGETVRNLFQVSFHSGTLPKVFARVRHAELQALKSGNYSAVRTNRATLQDVEEILAKFLEREFCYLLEQSPAWRGQGLRPTRVELSSNQIRLFLEHPRHEDEPLIVTLEYREGWVAAHLAPCSWLGNLSTAAHAALRNALVMFYKLADVDLIHEHLRSLLPQPEDHFDITSQGLVIWPTDRQGPPLQVYLVAETEQTVDDGTGAVSWDPKRVVFSEQRLTRDECMRCWLEMSEDRATIFMLLPGVRVLPSPVETTSSPPAPTNGDILDFNKSTEAVTTRPHFTSERFAEPR